MNLEDVESFLPDIVKDILALIGFPATVKLLDVIGGTTFPVGKGRQASGEARMELLVSTVGQDNADKLAQHFGGDILYIPRCERALKELRNRHFVADVDRLRDGGKSLLWIMTELCPKYGISDRLAYYILERARQQNSGVQRSLFEGE